MKSFLEGMKAQKHELLAIKPRMNLVHTTTQKISIKPSRKRTIAAFITITPLNSVNSGHFDYQIWVSYFLKSHKLHPEFLLVIFLL